MLGVNAERWAAEIPGFDANCTRCVIAADHTIEDFSFRNGYDSIVGTMNDLGEGSRGIVMLDRGPDIVGHVFNMVNNKGVVAFVDGQTGAFATLEKFENLFLLITKRVPDDRCK